MKNPLYGLPNRFFLVSASAVGKTELNAFDNALRKAGIGDYNLIKVSSILPPGAYEEKPDLPKGSLLPIAYGAVTTEKKDVVISAACAVGIPEGKEVGVIMEFADFVPKRTAEEKAVFMAEVALGERNLRIKEIKVCSSTMNTSGSSCAFAGVVLW